MKYFRFIPPTFKQRNTLIFNKIYMFWQFSADALIKHNLGKYNKVKRFVIFMCQYNTCCTILSTTPTCNIFHFT